MKQGEKPVRYKLPGNYRVTGVTERQFRFRAAAKFEIRFSDTMFYGDACGVYRVNFGDRYYIGSSRSIVSRMRTHQSHINLSFRFRKESYGVYKIILFHLWNNPQIIHASVEIICQCKPDDLREKEQAVLENCKGDPHCLNVLFTSGQRVNE